MRAYLKLYGGALLAGLLGMALMLVGVRVYRDYQDFQVMRGFVFAVIQQQQQRQAAGEKK